VELDGGVANAGAAADGGDPLAQPASSAAASAATGTAGKIRRPTRIAAFWQAGRRSRTRGGAP
jgi:hypothetical protein